MCHNDKVLSGLEIGGRKINSLISRLLYRFWLRRSILIFQYFHAQVHADSWNAQMVVFRWLTRRPVLYNRKSFGFLLLEFSFKGHFFRMGRVGAAAELTKR
jgi:hypothetical protein